MLTVIFRNEHISFFESFIISKKMKIALFRILQILSCTNKIGQERNKQIDNFLRDELPKVIIPNLEVLVVSKDSILYTKSLCNSPPSLTYYIGSVNRSLTAYGILNLIEQKQIIDLQKGTDSLINEKVGQYVANQITQGSKKRTSIKLF